MGRDRQADMGGDGTDNIGLIAAGVAFYGFLALVPLLGAIVLVYGLPANPATVMRNMTQLPRDIGDVGVDRHRV